MRNKFRKRDRTAVIVLITLIALTASGLTQKAIGIAGLSRLHQANDRYLQNSMNGSLATFGILSILKVGLDIVEGTEVGVGFGIQVGDAVQAAYDYVDIAWRTVLVSATVLLGTRYLLQMAGLLDQWFLVASLTACLFWTLFRLFFPGKIRILRLTKDLTCFLFIITASIYLLLPLSIAGGSLLSKSITSPSLREAESGMRQVQGDLFPESSGSSSGLWSKLVETKDRIVRLTEYLTRKTSELVEWGLRIMAGYIFDCILFPLLLFYFLYKCTRILGRYLFRMQTQDSMKNEFEKILIKWKLESLSSG